MERESGRQCERARYRNLDKTAARHCLLKLNALLAWTLVNTFTDICGEAIKRACPSRTVKANHKPPWWNTTLANLKRECRTYFNRTKYNNSESSWNLYHTILSLYKKEIRISSSMGYSGQQTAITFRRTGH